MWETLSSPHRKAPPFLEGRVQVYSAQRSRLNGTPPALFWECTFGSSLSNDASNDWAETARRWDSPTRPPTVPIKTKTGGRTDGRWS